MKPIRRAALYGRVSKREGQDTENQLAQLRQFCEHQGWEIVHEFVDHVTGKHSDRAQFKSVFSAASRKEFDALVTWALDRLSREGVAMTFEHIKTLMGYGVAYVSYTEPHFRTTGPAGELMIAVAAWTAQQERQRISDRVVAGLQQARKRGQRLGRPPVVVDRQRVAQLAAEGCATREIGEELGVSAASVCRILATL